MVIDKNRMIEGTQNPRTQNIFLEIGYNYDQAVYTLKEDHFTADNGYTYYSLKRLYVEKADPTEYEFAKEYLLNWKHWQRICDNKVLRKYIDEWREELEAKLRSKGVRNLIELAGSGSFQAAKWMSDMGWVVRGAGRPSKRELEASKKAVEDELSSYDGDVLRLIKK